MKNYIIAFFAFIPICALSNDEVEQLLNQLSNQNVVIDDHNNTIELNAININELLENAKHPKLVTNQEIRQEDIKALAKNEENIEKNQKTSGDVTIKDNNNVKIVNNSELADTQISTDKQNVKISEKISAENTDLPPNPNHLLKVDENLKTNIADIQELKQTVLSNNSQGKQIELNFDILENKKRHLESMKREIDTNKRQWVDTQNKYQSSKVLSAQDFLRWKR